MNNKLFFLEKKKNNKKLTFPKSVNISVDTSGLYKYNNVLFNLFIFFNCKLFMAVKRFLRAVKPNFKLSIETSNFELFNTKSRRSSQSLILNNSFSS